MADNDVCVYTVHNEDGMAEMVIFHTMINCKGKWSVHFPRYEFSGLYRGQMPTFETDNDILCFLFAYNENEAKKFYEWLRSVDNGK